MTPMLQATTISKPAFTKRATTLLALVILLGSCLVLVIFFGWSARRDAFQGHTRQAIDQATNLELHLTQSIQTLEPLASGIEPALVEFSTAQTDALNQRLSETIRPFSFLRSLSILNGQGTVVASSNRRNLGRQIPTATFYPTADPGSEILRAGTVWRGRDLADASPLNQNLTEEVDGPYFIPLLKALGGVTSGWQMVATLNADYFTTQFSQLLPIKEGNVQLLRRDGRVLISSDPRDVPGQTQGNPDIISPLDKQSTGQLGTGMLNGKPVLTAYRASPRFPFVMAVHHRHEAILADWKAELGKLFLTLMPVLVGLSMAAIMLWKLQLRVSSQLVQTLHQNEEMLAAKVAERTQQLQAKTEALEIAVEKQNALMASLDNLPTPIFIKDEDGIYLECNKAFAEYKGWSRQQIIGRTIYELSPLDFAAHHDAADKQLLADGGKQVFEAEVVCADGQRKDFVFHKAVFQDEDGVTRGLAGAMFDISDLNEVKRQLAETAAQAQQASEAKSEFLALMSHELRTPMAGVIGMLGLAMRGELSPVQRNQIMLAHDNARSLLAIVNDLLDFSKIEAGKLELELIDFSLRRLLADGLQVLEQRVQEKDLDLVLEIEPTVPPFQIGDPTRLRQVLINLISNAIKFTEKGCVTVKVGASPDPVAASNQMLRFEVSDTGIGMNEEAQSRLFQKFEQADVSTTRRFGGTGLGLAICKQLVEMMGGHIDVRSQPGVGSTFFFEVRLPLGQEPTEEVRPELLPHQRQLNVLVAEDSYTNQIIIQCLLDEMGHTVTIAENGALVMEALSEVKFDVILMDGRMPVVDGLQASRLIRAGEGAGLVPLQKDIPIIAITANASPQDRENFMAAGVNEFLTKPIDEVDLHQALERLIG